MNVTLYYVEGISRIDTPYFATKTTQASLEKQEEFFTSKIVKTIQLSYYPPHYRNAIRFDEDDLTINDNVNYLSLDYNGKKYYYFIDSINYISESLIEVEITMDVIQTYMFDIYISNGIIERKFINRLIAGEYNRAYIRENVSNNEYVYYTHQVYNSDIKQWLVFIPVTTYLCIKQANMIVKFNKNLPGLLTDGFINTSYCTYITTYYPSVYSGHAWEDTLDAKDIMPSSDVTNGSMDITTAFGEWSSHNVTVDMYICPFNCSTDITLTYVSSLGKVRVTADTTYDDSSVSPVVRHTGAFYAYLHRIELVSGQAVIPTYCLAPDNDPVAHGALDGAYNPVFNSKVLTGGQDIGNFASNGNRSVPYSSRYITQMLDENYIRIKYGSINNYTSIPLYLLTLPRFRYNAAFNPNDGSRIYWLDSYDAIVPDVFNTVTIDNNVLHYDLKNDPWKEYVAANRGRWAAATVNTALTIFTKGAYNNMQNKFANQEINDIMANPKSYDRRYKEPKLKTKPANMVAARERDIEAHNMNTKIGAVDSAKNNLVTQAFQDYNVACQPPTPKQVGNVGGIGAKDAYIMYYEEHVQDYEQCAQYYHRNGFLVNEYINGTDNIFGYVFNRYYFNILKMQLPNVHLHNVIEDEDTINAITDRLVDGLRLWNVMYEDVSLGDFQYDNVELLYL